MSPAISDRWLLVTAGVFFVAAAFGIRYAIADILSLTEIEPLPRPSAESFSVSDGEQHTSQATGSNLHVKLSTLRTLVASPQESIKTAAQAIVIHRFIADPVQIRAIVADFFSSNAELHRQAFQTACFVIDFIRVHDADWNSPIKLEARMAKKILRALIAWEAGEADAEDDARRGPVDLTSSGALRESLSGAEKRQLSSVDFWFLMGQDCQSWAGVRAHAISWNLAQVMNQNMNSTYSPCVPKPAATLPGLRALPSGVSAEERLRRHRRREAIILHEGAGRIIESDIIRPRI